MREELDELLNDIAGRVLNSTEEVEAFRVEFLGRQGKMKDLMSQFRDVAPEDMSPIKREL